MTVADWGLQPSTVPTPSVSWEYHDMAAYTSAGVSSSIVPVRINCLPEITLQPPAMRLRPLPATDITPAVCPSRRLQFARSIAEKP
jgi:hypothetical protein